MNCTVVGKGRIGLMLKSLLPEAHMVGRADPIPSGHPIIVATRCDDLDDVIARVSKEGREKLIFVQNGMLHSWNVTNGLENTTQALMYVAVSSRGSEPVDGGRTVVTGPHAEFFCSILRKGGFLCRSISQEEYQAELVEKFVWNCGFGLLCQHFSCTVGEVVRDYKEEANILLWELASDTSTLMDCSIDEGVCERLCAYSESIFSYRGAVKEWKWRNGWLWDRKKGAQHQRYLLSLGLITAQ